jgi:hypothetical protein
MECSAFAYGGFDSRVEDFDNVLYTDPMTVDFSPVSDADFLCFEYQILQRYDMLNIMPDDRRRKALAIVNQSASASWNDWQNVAQLGGGWNQAQEDSSSGHPWSGPTPSLPGGDAWANLNNGGSGGNRSVMSEDHYGRLQVMSQPSQKKTKRF